MLTQPCLLEFRQNLSSAMKLQTFRSFIFHSRSLFLFLLIMVLSKYLSIDTAKLLFYFRRMFPTVRVSFTGIRPDQRYAVLLDIVPVDNKRYRYAYHRSSWLVAGKADPPAPCRMCAHPDSPFSGEQLRKQVVSFEKVKLTNNEMDKHGHVCYYSKHKRTIKQRDFLLLQLVLNSMHKYQPRIHLVKRPDGASGQIVDLENEEYKTFIFPETVFTAVTAYQNQLVSYILLKYKVPEIHVFRL